VTGAQPQWTAVNGAVIWIVVRNEFVGRMRAKSFNAF
jgi:hypothetical protein